MKVVDAASNTPAHQATTSGASGDVNTDHPGCYRPPPSWSPATGDAHGQIGIEGMKKDVQQVESNRPGAKMQQQGPDGQRQRTKELWRDWTELPGRGVLHQDEVIGQIADAERGPIQKQRKRTQARQKNWVQRSRRPNWRRRA